MQLGRILRCCVLSGALWHISSAPAGTDIHFDYTSFDNPNTPGISPHFGQSQFDVLNYPSINGNYMMTSTDNHRPEMTANNNALAEFYNFLQDRYNEQTVKDGAAAADKIDQYTVSNSTKNGAKPNWIVLNEMSTSLWPSSATYRTWVVNVAARLHDTYGYNVVTYTTFANPASNASDWQALAAKSYIGIENYLSGSEIMSHGTDYASRVAWAQAQYVWSKTPYGNLGVPTAKLFLGEHFGNTVSGDGWGRAGISSADWDMVLQIRQDAIYNANYSGFLAYGWGSNGMLASEAEQLQHEYYYRSRLVLQSQQRQWLADTTINLNGTLIPLSWSQPLNWIGGVPNANGAVANFFRTNTAARTVTLDGSTTIGSMSLNSANSYTISAGSGGSLTLNNSGAGASVVVPLGSHTISAPIFLGDTATFNVTTSLTLSGEITNSSGKAITKTGVGTLTISGLQTHGTNASLIVSAGTLNLNSDAGSTSVRNLAVTSNSTTNFGATQHLKSLAIGNAAVATLASGGGKALVTNTLSIASGKLNLTNNALIVTAGGVDPVRSLIMSGFSGGSWAGNGIITTIAAPSGKTVRLGYAQGNDPNLASLGNTLNGESFPSSSDYALVKFTYQGDADLDGDVDGVDVASWASNFTGNLGLAVGTSVPSKLWTQGDWDYDGDVDGTDVARWANNFTGSGGGALGMTIEAPNASAPAVAMLAAMGITVVPEPAGLAVAFATIALLTRRQRSK